ncbi:MAG: helix-turn-helix domain-containing protein [Polyangiaceae bacterium]
MSDLLLSALGDPPPWGAALVAEVAGLRRDLRDLLIGSRCESKPTLDLPEAAELLGYSRSGLRKLLKRDADLARCYSKAPGAASKLVFDRRALLAWRESRR